MNRNKQPKMYVSGILSENLSENEKKLALIWSKFRQSYDIFIWDIFSLNGFGKSYVDLIDTDLVRSIKGIEFKKIEDGVYTIFIPKDYNTDQNQDPLFLKLKFELMNVIKDIKILSR
jgi:hypothetical protein